MKRLIYLSLAALMTLTVAVSCKKDGPGKSKYGVDGKTPMPESIDLGLPSGLKWASFNLGATKPEEYGDYYAWGETEKKSNYSWSTYKFGTSKSGPFSKYNSTDNNAVLETGPNGDDVASKKLGGKWRMPTDAEWAELRTNCTWDRTTQNGVNGCLVKSKTNGKSIFLPAAGYRFDADLLDAGSNGDYWSSSLYTEYPYVAWYVYFESDTVNGYGDDRCFGYSVRPVWEE